MHGDSVILKYKKRIMKVLNQVESGCVVEVGSTRDAGSTFHLASMANQSASSFYSIDPSTTSNADAKEVLSKFSNPKMEAVLEKGEVFLNEYDGNDIVLAYLDGFDIVTEWPHKQSTIDFYTSVGIDLLKDGNRLSAEVHLDTTKGVLKNMPASGFICFDDTWKEKGEWKGKGATAVPYLLKQGFRLVNRARPFRKPYYNHGVLLERIK